MRSSTSTRFGSEGEMYSVMALLSMLVFLLAVTKKPIPKTRIGYRVGDHENNICLTLRSLPLGDVATLATMRRPDGVASTFGVQKPEKADFSRESDGRLSLTKPCALLRRRSVRLGPNRSFPKTRTG
jgi:hypothetical protein